MPGHTPKEKAKRKRSMKRKPVKRNTGHKRK